MVDVLIAIPSYRRPRSLEALLRSIENIDTAGDVVRVIVGDNDVDRKEARAVVERLNAEGWRYPLRAITVSEPGLCSNRNALLHAFLETEEAPFMIMIDDDQTVSPGWYRALRKMRELTKADVIGPWVEPAFPPGSPDWASRAKIFREGVRGNGLVPFIPVVHATLISRAAILRMARPMFDPQFNLTSGEDVDFCRRLKQAGALFACAAEARVTEHYPASRVTLAWALQRAYRGGNSNVAVARAHTTAPLLYLRETGKICAKLMIGSVKLATLFWSPARRVDALCDISRAVGKAAGLYFGARYQEYAKTHGA